MGNSSGVVSTEKNPVKANFACFVIDMEMQILLQCVAFHWCKNSSTPVLRTFLDRVGLYLNAINIIWYDICGKKAVWREDVAWCILKSFVCKKAADIIWIDNFWENIFFFLIML